MLTRYAVAHWLLRGLASAEAMLVTLAKFLDPWEAYIVRARLQADGIPATVAFANHAIANWPVSLALGGTVVQVPVSFLEQAREILADYRSGALEDEMNDAVGSQKEHCPRCGSCNFKRTLPWRKRLYATLVVLFVAVYPIKYSLLVCGACGFRWHWGEA